MSRWAVLTGEYPPDVGGVSDYTRLVARGLADAGDEVRVYAPGSASPTGVADPGVIVHRLPGRFGPRTLTTLDRLLTKRPRPDRVLVQYTPHAFGFKAMNLPFALWVAARLRQIAPVWVMFHEVNFPFSWRPAKYAVLGGVTRLMARLMAGAAVRNFVSIPAWGDCLKQLCPPSRPAEWLPVPCNVATDADPETVAAVRKQLVPGDCFLVGHFGTYGGLVAELLGGVMTELLRLVPTATILLLGRTSEPFRNRFASTYPELAGRVAAAGELAPTAVSAHLRACDLLVQPFPDGISSRRTSAMAGLANGVAVVTNLGFLSEAVWAARGVAAVPTPDPVAMAHHAAALLANPAARAELGRRGVDLYRDIFALEHTLARLRTPT